MTVHENGTAKSNDKKYYTKKVQLNLMRKSTVHEKDTAKSNEKKHYMTKVQLHLIRKHIA